MNTGDATFKRQQDQINNNNRNVRQRTGVFMPPIPQAATLVDNDDTGVCFFFLSVYFFSHKKKQKNRLSNTLRVNTTIKLCHRPIFTTVTITSTISHQPHATLTSAVSITTSITSITTTHGVATDTTAFSTPTAGRTT